MKNRKKTQNNCCAFPYLLKNWNNCYFIINLITVQLLHLENPTGFRVSYYFSISRTSDAGFRDYLRTFSYGILAQKFVQFCMAINLADFVVRFFARYNTFLCGNIFSNQNLDPSIFLCWRKFLSILLVEFN